MLFEKPKRAPINTEAQDPLVHLMDALEANRETGDPSNAILRQEAQGQQSFVNSDTLPTRTNDHRVDSKKVLMAAGVKFGDVVPGDPLFQYVELPKGWKKVGTGHSMWSSLVDDKGRKRASIFYKAAFYDRDAFYSVDRRYSTRIDYTRKEKEGVTVAYVMDGETIIYTTEPISGTEYELSDQATAAATKWLEEHFPNWEDPGSYWD